MQTIKKILKFATLKNKAIPWQKNSVTYYPTLKDVKGWPLRLERRKKRKNLQKLKKFARFVKKMLKFVMLKC